MKPIIFLLFIFTFSSVKTTSQVSPIIALIGGQIIIGDETPVIKNGTILFKEGRIVAIGDSTDVKVPANASKLFVHGRTVMPGMIEGNGHVTFDGQFDHGTYWTLNIDNLYAIGSRNLISTLSQGITTLRDTKGPLETMLQLKKDTKAGLIAGSRLFTCGLILNYGSFGQLFDQIDKPESGVPSELIQRAREALILPVKNKEDGIRIVRDYAAKGVDFIKVSAFSTPNEMPPTLHFETLKAIIDEAHSLGLKTTTHAMSASSVEASIDAGSDAIEHPQLTSSTVPLKEGIISPKLATKMAKNKVYGVPLMVAADVYLRYYSNPSLLNSDKNLKAVPKERLEEGINGVAKIMEQYPNIAEIYQSRAPNRLRNMKNLIEAGVPIAMGTDRGTRLNYHQSANHIREMEIYLELGMSPMQVIQSATIRGAELLGLEEELGSLELGKLADIIVIKGNPLENIRDLENVEMVFKEGKRYY